MEKEEALNEFLKGLRIVINNASAYHRGHPYFIKSVDIFKTKIETLFSFLSPIKINITPNSLFMDGRYLEKATLHLDLASMLHLRKIKSIELRQGLNNEELIDFLSAIALPIKEILRRGGMQNILNREKNPHISIDELDYSELLRDGGEESKDIWVYLFKAATQNDDLAKIHAYAENFEKIINQFRANDLYEDAELRQNIYNFLMYLKATEKEKFYNCSKDLLRLLLRDKDIPQEEKFDRIKILFQDLSNEDLTEALLESISKDDDFNNLSFAVFHRLFDENRNKDIATTLESKLKNTEFLRNNPKIRKKIKELFSVSDESNILPLYKQAVLWLAQEHVAENIFSYDQEILQVNYRLLLFNLLEQEKDIQSLELISELLLKECDNIVKENNIQHLKFLSEVLDKKIKDDPHLITPLDKLQDRISHFVENTVFEYEKSAGMEYFIDTLRTSSLGFEFYLNKIFNEKIINPLVLKLLLKLFPEKLHHFYKNLENTKFDMDFLAKIVKSFEGLESPLSLEVLKRIFYFSNNIIRMEVLKSMHTLSTYDEEFLLSVLRKEEIILKKEALLILARDENSRIRAMQELFAIPSPLGKKNKVIMENIMVIEGIVGCELKEAREHLTVFSKKRFFWNRNIREKATEVLKKLNVRKD
jgi:hypothetical protein